MKTKLFNLLCCAAILGLTACNQPTKETADEPYGNPAAEGFNATESDAQAIAVADHCYGCTAGQGSSCSGAL